MDLIEQIKQNARENRQRIVLPEGDEERTIKAADQLIADGIADVILIGPAQKIKDMAAEFGLNNIEKATIVDPTNNPDRDKYANLLFELRKSKGMTIEEAQKRIDFYKEKLQNIEETDKNYTVKIQSVGLLSLFCPLVQPVADAIHGDLQSLLLVGLLLAHKTRHKVFGQCACHAVFLEVVSLSNGRGAIIAFHFIQYPPLLSRGKVG